MHDRITDLNAPPSIVERSTSAVPRGLRRYLSLDDFEATARARLPKFLYGYISGGAESDAAVRDIVNEAAEFATNDPEPDAAELWTNVYR